MSQTIDPRNIEIIDDALAAVLRNKTPAERIAMAADANETARKLAAAGIRHDHPDWSQRDVESEVARRMLGEAD
jgi:Rv0078B-related antitoxin